MEDVKQTRFGRKAMSLFLSGAMVVAFAPAVAAPLAEAAAVADGTSVKISFDLDGGTSTAATSFDSYTGKIASENGKTIVKGIGTVSKGNSYDFGTIAKDGYAFGGWWVDWDADGKVAEDGSETVANVNGDLVIPDAKGISGSLVEADGTIDAKLVAQYKVLDATLAESPVYQTAADAAEKTAFKLTLENAIATHNYTLAVTEEGVAEPIYTTSKALGSTLTNGYTLTWTATAGEATENSGKIYNGFYGAGKYTLTVTDADAAGDGVSVSKDFEIAEVTLSAGAGEFEDAVASKSVLAGKGAAWSTVLEALPAENPTYKVGEKTYNVVSYQDGGGKDVLVYKNGEWSVADGVAGEVSATTLTATYNIARVTSVGLSYKKDTDEYALSYAATDLPAEGTRTIAVTGPDGFKWTRTFTTGLNANPSRTLAFGGSNDTATATTARVEDAGSGTYTVTITDTPATGAATAVSGSVDVIAVTYDSGAEGYLDSKTENGKTTYVTTKTFYAESGTLAKDANNAFAPTVKRNEGTLYAFKGWSTDGTKDGVITNRTETALSADTTLQAYYEVDTVEKPVVTVTAPAAAGGKYTFTATDATEGATVQYKTNENTWNVLQSSGLETDAASVSFKAVKADMNESGTVTYLSAASQAAAAAVSAYKASIGAILAQNGAKDPVTVTDSSAGKSYASEYPDVAADGEKALKALGYLVAEDWAAAANAQLQDDFEAFATAVGAQIDIMAAGVADGKGTTTYLPDEDAAAARSAVVALSSELDKAVKAANTAASPAAIASDSDIVVKISDGTNEKVAEKAGVATIMAAAVKAQKTAKTDEWEAAAALGDLVDAVASGDADAFAAAKSSADAAVAAVADAETKAELEAQVRALDDAYAVVKAAAALTDASEPADVEAALGAYAALSDAARAYVPGDTLGALASAANQAAAKLEAGVKEAQADAESLLASIKAAVKATKPAATVKAGKKKLTVKAAKGTLEKLGKVTYKYRVKKGTKAGGTWKTLKVGKTVTVKKLAKGKKYTVQVKATVDGTAAKTFKKTVKVK